MSLGNYHMHEDEKGFLRLTFFSTEFYESTEDTNM